MLMWAAHMLLSLQATVHLDLLDLPASVAIVSRSQSEPTACGSGSCPGASPTFATYRCQDSTNRLSVRFRARETAEGGKVTAFIVPTAPDRNCPVLEAALAPLCLHQPITAGSVGAAEGEEPIEWLRRCRPVSEVVLTGVHIAQWAVYAQHMVVTLPRNMALAPLTMNTMNGPCSCICIIACPCLYHLQEASV